MDKDKILAKEETKNLPLGKKIKHYLYYYKLHIVVTVAVILLAGIYFYQRSNEVDYNLTISVYSDQMIDIDLEEKNEEIVSAWLGEGKLVDMISICTPKIDLQTAQQTSVAYTKLDGQLAAGTMQAVIFDEYVYETVMTQREYSSVMMEEYSCEIGENAKEILGLNKSIKYYYLTRVLYDNEKDNQEAIARQKCAMEIYEKIRELN